MKPQNFWTPSYKIPKFFEEEAFTLSSGFRRNSESVEYYVAIVLVKNFKFESGEDFTTLFN